MIPGQRHLFDIPEEMAYFNCAYYSPQLKESTVRLRAAADEKRYPWERIPAHFFDDAETIRQLSGTLFGGSPDGYAVVPSASYGLSTAARTVEPMLQKGDRIVVMAEEFPSNVLPWRTVCRFTGAEMVAVPAPQNNDWTDAILNTLDKTVKVAALSTCHWTNGAKVNLEEIACVCRDLGTVLVVDATQSLGAMPFSMKEVQPDFLVASGYKWLLFPYGVSLLYVSERWWNARPLEESWMARSNAEDFTSLVHYSDFYQPGARRFEVGEKCTGLLPGAIAALEQIKAWGISEIASTLSFFNHQISLQLRELGFSELPEKRRCPHLFGATLPEHYHGDLVSDLKARNIFISRRGNSLRFSPHLYVSDFDLARLLDVLADLTKKKR